MKMTRSLWMRAGLVVAAALALSVVGTTPAFADDTVSEGDTCWFNTDSDVTQCFDSDAAFLAAVAEQTGGVLLLAGDEAPQARGGVQPFATYVLATFYDPMYRTGTSVNITTSISTMCTTHSYTGNSMPSGWNDRVSSFQGWGTCKVKLYENTNLGGSYFGPYQYYDFIAGMDNAASSYWITG